MVSLIITIILVVIIFHLDSCKLGDDLPLALKFSCNNFLIEIGSSFEILNSKFFCVLTNKLV
jgi:hypothetical protein